MVINVFSFFHSPVWNKTPERTMSLEDVYQYLTGGQAEQRTLRLRSIKDAAEARKYKSQAFDYVTFSGVFNRCCDADAKCANESRACFLPHDPECYINMSNITNTL